LRAGLALILVAALVALGCGASDVQGSGRSHAVTTEHPRKEGKARAQEPPAPTAVSRGTHLKLAPNGFCPARSGSCVQLENLVTPARKLPVTAGGYVRLRLHAKAKRVRADFFGCGKARDLVSRSSRRWRFRVSHEIASGSSGCDQVLIHVRYPKGQDFPAGTGSFAFATRPA
jgi:hypothetical protein